MNLRYTLPRVQGRGAGLGNELIPWARAFLAAQVLDAHCLEPAFGMNPRRYWHHFDTPRYDWLSHKAMVHMLPHIQLTQADYIRCGGGDFVNAFQIFAKEHKLYQRSCYVLSTEGMWGGYRHIAAARDFVYATLYQSRFAARNLLALQARLNRDKVTVAMHVRMGDFGAAPSQLSDYQGKFNLALPLQWYCNVARSIQQQLGDDVQFLVVSDGTPAQLCPVLDNLDAITTADIPDSDCSDVLALANADMLVCSISSFSLTAAFLSKAPYLWFEPNLQRHDNNFYSIWGHEKSQLAEGSGTFEALKKSALQNTMPKGRGTPIPIDGQVPSALLKTIVDARQMQCQHTDLLFYGVVKNA